MITKEQKEKAIMYGNFMARFTGSDEELIHELQLMEDNGNSCAATYLGMFLDDKTSKKHFMKAVEIDNHPTAMECLSLYAMDASLRARKEERKAQLIKESKEWAHKAALKGNANGMYILGIHAFTEQKWVEAFYWLYRAVANHSKRATDNMDNFLIHWMNAGRPAKYIPSEYPEYTKEEYRGALSVLRYVTTSKDVDASKEEADIKKCAEVDKSICPLSFLIIHNLQEVEPPDLMAAKHYAELLCDRGDISGYRFTAMVQMEQYTKTHPFNRTTKKQAEQIYKLPAEMGDPFSMLILAQLELHVDNAPLAYAYAEIANSYGINEEFLQKFYEDDEAEVNRETEEPAHQEGKTSNIYLFPTGGAAHQQPKIIHDDKGRRIIDLTGHPYKS